MISLGGDIPCPVSGQIYPLLFISSGYPWKLKSLNTYSNEPNYFISHKIAEIPKLFLGKQCRTLLVRFQDKCKTHEEKWLDVTIFNDEKIKMTNIVPSYSKIKFRTGSMLPFLCFKCIFLDKRYIKGNKNKYKLQIHQTHSSKNELIEQK